MSGQLGWNAFASGLFQPSPMHVSRGIVPRSHEDGRAGTGPSSSRGRVLIVEDEYFVALDAEDALSAAGFTVVGVATTAEEAAEMAAAERPDMVLMDVRLAGLRDGIDAAAEIRARFGILSLFATAHSDAATRSRGAAVAAPLGWLSKPYTPGDVAAAVSEAIIRVRRGGEGGA